MAAQTAGIELKVESRPEKSGMRALFLRVAPRDIALIKFVLESYEGIAVVRTIDRRAALIVVLVADDFRDVVAGALASLAEHVRIEETPAPPEASDDWLLQVLWERTD
jgi:hypothetical protein